MLLNKSYLIDQNFNNFGGNIRKTLVQTCTAPDEAVLFLLDIYAGGQQKSKLKKCCGILDLLEDGEDVIAYQGFDLQNTLQKVLLSICHHFSMIQVSYNKRKK